MPRSMTRIASYIGIVKIWIACMSGVPEVAMKTLILAFVVSLLSGCGAMGMQTSGGMGPGAGMHAEPPAAADPFRHDDVFHSYIN